MGNGYTPLALTEEQMRAGNEQDSDLFADASLVESSGQATSLSLSMSISFTDGHWMNEDAKDRLIQLVKRALQPNTNEPDPISVCGLEISFSDDDGRPDQGANASGAIEVEISIPGEEEERADQIIEDVKARWESFAQAASEDQNETYILSAQVA